MVNIFTPVEGPINQQSTQVTPILPGPLIIADSAIEIWNVTTATAQDRVQNYQSVLPVHDPIRTTTEERCWLTLMALQREQELRECCMMLDRAQRELDEVRKILGIGRD